MTEKMRIPTSEMMQLTGLSRARLSELVAAGVIPKSERGFFPYPDAPAAYCAHLRESAAGRSDTDLSQARARLAMLQGDGHALKNAVARGEYLLTTHVRDRWDTAASTIQIRVMGAVTEIAQALHLTRHDTETVDRVIRDALTQAADEIDALGPMEGERE